MIEGRYFQPEMARSEPAKLWGERDDLRLVIGDDQTVHRPVLASVSDKLGNVPRKLTFVDGSVFEVAAGADIDTLLGSHGHFFSRLSRLEASWKFVSIAAVVTVGLLFGLYRYGLPALAAGAAAVTPTVVVTSMDRGTLETVDRLLLSETKTSTQKQEEVQALFDDVAKASGHTNPPLRLLFRNGGPVGANAFALPGGTIVITDQLIEKAKSDDEIAGVLAHEIGHVAGQHSLKQLYRVLGIGFMIGVIGGDSGQLVDDVVSQASALQTFAYTREFEADADRQSVETMIRAGRDPLAFVDLLDRIGGDRPGSDETGWLDTHPGNKDRRAATEALAKKLGWQK